MKILNVLILVLFGGSIFAQNDKKDLHVHHVNIGLEFSSFSKFKFNNYLNENQINNISNFVFGAKINNTFIFSNNFGLYSSWSFGGSSNKGNDQVTKLNVSQIQFGPSYKIVHNSNLSLVISPLLSYQNLGVNLLFNSPQNLSSFLQNNSGNMLRLNKSNYCAGLNLSSEFFNQFTLEFVYLYNLNSSAFKMVGNSANNNLPLGRNNVFSISVLTRLK